jgi:carboxypeptidase Q
MLRRLVVTALALAAAPALPAQSFPSTDSVIRRIWVEGMDSSQAYNLAQALMDSIGPRLTGTPGIKSGNDWLVARYQSWGITARNVQYGTWRGWRRGVTHVDLVQPRVRTLEATMLAWSPGTKGKVQGGLVILPDVPDSSALRAWLPQVKDKFVLISFPQPTCRPDSSFKQFATSESFERMVEQRTAAREAWTARLGRTGYTNRTLPVRLEQAGAKGVLTSTWSQGWGVNKIFGAYTTQVPTLDISCEDYGLLYRLAERNQGPVIQVEAQAESLGEIPVFNTIAEIRGREKPNEYVILSAHFDSWDAGSGATDNGTGTTTMLEAMRILRTAYPNPRRTILVGHWSGEEQGLNGSRAYAADHPEVVRGVQAVFNQDNGTGRVSTIGMAGMLDAGSHFGRWLTRIPSEISRHITLSFPGNPAGGGSDHAAFACYGAPAFGLGSNSWEYGTYTWHTNRDTFDKISFDEIRNNATLTAMLAYLASEDPDTIGRTRRVMGTNNQGQQQTWPTCQTPARTSAESTR